jgi:hypothetical protein
MVAAAEAASFSASSRAVIEGDIETVSVIGTFARV